MSNQVSYSTEITGPTLVVIFNESQLVFPDQLRPVESQLALGGSEADFQSAVFDFSGVTYISSSIWGELIRLNKLLQDGGCACRLCNLTAPLQEALEVMKLEELLPVSPTRQDALAEFAS